MAKEDLESLLNRYSITAGGKSKEKILDIKKVLRDDLDRLILETAFGLVNEDEFEKRLSSIVSSAKMPNEFLDNYELLIRKLYGDVSYEDMCDYYSYIGEIKDVLLDAERYSYTYVTNEFLKSGFKEQFMNMVNEYYQYAHLVGKEFEKLQILLDEPLDSPFKSIFPVYDKDHYYEILCKTRSKTGDLRNSIERIKNISVTDVNKGYKNQDVYENEECYSIEFLDFLDENIDFDNVFSKLEYITQVGVLSDDDCNYLKIKYAKLLITNATIFFALIAIACIIFSHIEPHIKDFSMELRFLIEAMFFSPQWIIALIFADKVSQPVLDSINAQKKVRKLRKELSKEISDLDHSLS